MDSNIIHLEELKLIEEEETKLIEEEPRKLTDKEEVISPLYFSLFILEK